MLKSMFSNYKIMSVSFWYLWIPCETTMIIAMISITAWFLVPRRGLEDGKVNLPSGKILGGSTAINYMAYVRGSPKDYDLWAEKLGADGWSWKEVIFGGWNIRWKGCWSQTSGSDFNIFQHLATWNCHSRPCNSVDAKTSVTGGMLGTWLQISGPRKRKFPLLGFGSAKCLVFVVCKKTHRSRPLKTRKGWTRWNCGPFRN